MANTDDTTPTPTPWLIAELPVRTDLQAQIGTFFQVHLDPSALGHRRVIAMATAGIDLLLNLGGAFSLETFGDSTRVEPGVYLAGPRPTTAFLRPEGELNLLAARFKHGVIAPLLPYPAKELEQRFMPVAALWPDADAALKQAIAQSKGTADLIHRVENELKSLLAGVKRPDPLVRKAVKAIAMHQGDLEVSALADQLGVSRQTVKHKFDQHVGMGPKLYGKLRRFQSMLGCLSGSVKVDWTKVAHNSGYYDQAHLIREFNHFTGFSPQKFVKNLEKGDDLYLFDSADQTQYHLTKRKDRPA